ncbi:MAG: hypothetical protein ACLFU4_08925 [Opitutales bacterium]
MNTKRKPLSAAPTLYLWLSCEGWVRFGPFRHLRWRKCPEGGGLRITDQGNRVIAFEDREQGCWRSTESRYHGSAGSGWAFRDPMVTASPEHPHPKRF